MCNCRNTCLNEFMATLHMSLPIKSTNPLNVINRSRLRQSTFKILTIYPLSKTRLSNSSVLTGSHVQCTSLYSFLIALTDAYHHVEHIKLLSNICTIQSSSQI